MSSSLRTAVAIVMAVAVLAPALAAADSAAPPGAPAFPDSAHRSRLDHPRRMGLLAAAGVLIAGLSDRAVEREAPAARSSLARSLATAGERLGNPIVLAPALAGGWLIGRVTGSSALEGGAVRLGGAALGAGVACMGLKFAFGRSRPRQSPGDPDDFSPFHGNLSFPSGHATLAFALASALDQETSSRWVPWVAYPAASLTGWSRLHDREHWMSDVVGGAALGFWMGREIDRRERACGIRFLDVRPLWRRHAHGVRVGIGTSF